MRTVGPARKHVPASDDERFFLVELRPDYERTCDKMLHLQAGSCCWTGSARGLGFRWLAFCARRRSLVVNDGMPVAPRRRRRACAREAGGCFRRAFDVTDLDRASAHRAVAAITAGSTASSTMWAHATAKPLELSLLKYAHKSKQIFIGAMWLARAAAHRDDPAKYAASSNVIQSRRHGLVP